ncbi:hypothetical protein GCM10009543_29890 [Leifsonia naganoensis]
MRGDDTNVRRRPVDCRCATCSSPLPGPDGAAFLHIVEGLGACHNVCIISGIPPGGTSPPATTIEG